MNFAKFLKIYFLKNTSRLDFNEGSTKKDHLQESASPSTLLKLKSTTDIFSDQVNKFQNSDFKEYPWKAVIVLQKSMYFKNML